MAVMKALVMAGDGKTELKTNWEVPGLRDRYLLVKNKAVALNPTDWQHIDDGNIPGLLFGSDFAGVVEKTGKGYKKTWKVGDRICGFAHGGNELNPEDGTFAEYIVAIADLQMRIPDHLSFEDAATLGVASVTCGQGLFSPIGLNLSWPDKPSTKNEPLLIYGGSTAMGTFGIQLAKLAGYRVYSTCSPKNFDLVKSLGAIEVFDYNDPDCVSKINKATNNELRLIWDTIATDSTLKICSQVIGSGGIYATLEDAKIPRDDVVSKMTMGYTATGEPIKKSHFDNFQQDDTTEDFNFAVKWIGLVERLLAEDKVRPHPILVSDKGLGGIPEGLDLLRKKKVSGQKLVYTI